MLKVMIAEDDTNELQNFCNYLTNETNFEIVATTTTGQETIDNYLEKKPDVLFLDLDMPNVDGLGVLNNLKRKSDKKNIIVTSYSKELVSNIYDFSNIYQLLLKPYKYEKAVYSAQEIFSSNSLVSAKETIKNILCELKFNPSSSGTSNFIDLIYIKYQRKHCKLSLKDLYSIVASDLGGFYSSMQVKWSIDNSLSSARRLMDKKLLYSLFSNYNPAFELTTLYLTDLIIGYLEKVN